MTAQWRTAQDRELWSKIIKEVKAHKGLYRQRRRRIFPSSTEAVRGYNSTPSCLHR
jgi:hypothetical protein